jgi:hypothetical protein
MVGNAPKRVRAPKMYTEEDVEEALLLMGNGMSICLIPMPHTSTTYVFVMCFYENKTQ